MLTEHNEKIFQSVSSVTYRNHYMFQLENNFYKVKNVLFSLLGQINRFSSYFSLIGPGRAKYG